MERERDERKSVATLFAGGRKEESEGEVDVVQLHLLRLLIDSSTESKSPQHSFQTHASVSSFQIDMTTVERVSTTEEPTISWTDLMKASAGAQRGVQA